MKTIRWKTSFAETLNRLRVTNIIATERPNYPLSLVVGPGERVVLRSYYDRGLFADETIERLLEQLQVLLEGIASDPRQRVRELSLLSDGERERLGGVEPDGARVSAREQHCGAV